MAERVVRHAVFSWPDPEVPGSEKMAFRGARVALPVDVERLADEFGALEPLGYEPATAVPEPVTPDLETSEADAPSGRPRRIAPKEAWVAWAVAQGADHDEAEATSKNDLISLYGG